MESSSRSKSVSFVPSRASVTASVAAQVVVVVSAVSLAAEDSLVVVVAVARCADAVLLPKSRKKKAQSGRVPPAHTIPPPNDALLNTGPGLDDDD